MILLEAGDARAMITPQGAEIRSWDIGERPLLWQPDGSVWPETAPILFPVVGWTRAGTARVGAKTYPLGLHGFARHRRFAVLQQDRTSVRLQLASDHETLALYPFAFALAVEHRLTPLGLETVLDVVNSGEVAMPYACGVHPGFRWPFSGGDPEDYQIRFAMPEDPNVPELDGHGLMSSRRRRIPLDETVLRLRQELFAGDALCFLNAKSRSLRFEAPDGTAICLETTDFPHLALWCRPGHGYLCLEAWTGYSDPDEFAGDLFTKPSMRLLAPGGRARHAARFSFTRPQAPASAAAGP